MGPIEVLGFVSEGSLMLWLLVMGVNSQRWEDLVAGLSIQARVSAQT